LKAEASQKKLFWGGMELDYPGVPGFKWDILNWRTDLGSKKLELPNFTSFKWKGLIILTTSRKFGGVIFMIKKTPLPCSLWGRIFIPWGKGITPGFIGEPGCFQGFGLPRSSQGKFSQGIGLNWLNLPKLINGNCL